MASRLLECELVGLKRRSFLSRWCRSSDGTIGEQELTTLVKALDTGSFWDEAIFLRGLINSENFALCRRLLSKGSTDKQAVRNLIMPCYGCGP